MKPLDTIELMQVWEKGAGQSLLEKTMSLLSVACGTTDKQEMGSLSLGERDLRLLQLRECQFGTRMQNIADCPACGEIAEWETDTRSLRLQAMGETSARTFLADTEAGSIRYRLPDSFDVARIHSGSLYTADHRHLIADCILEINGVIAKPGLDDLPLPIWEQLDLQMEQHDPQADINMELSCAACGHTWVSWFDIVSYLWTEINGWALRCLQEVYTLARSFGWAEQDILSMNPRRRQLYLQMLHGS